MHIYIYHIYIYHIYIYRIYICIWRFPKMGLPQNGWFTVQTSHSKMDDLGLYPRRSHGTPIAKRCGCVPIVPRTTSRS